MWIPFPKAPSSGIVYTWGPKISTIGAYYNGTHTLWDYGLFRPRVGVTAQGCRSGSRLDDAADDDDDHDLTSFL